MASEELTVMFVYLYNTLVLHAYIEIEHFPTCIWDWRYLERTAFYTIGGVAYSLFDIHHGILRHNRLSPFGSDHPFVENDPRLSLLSNVADNPCTLFTLSDHTRYVLPLFHFHSPFVNYFTSPLSQSNLGIHLQCLSSTQQVWIMT